MKINLKLCFNELLWSFFYCIFCYFFAFYFFDFNPFSFSEWVLKYQSFMDGIWTISSFSDFILLTFIFLFFPIWLLGVWGITKINSFNFFHFLKSKTVLKKNSVFLKKILTEKEKFVPPKLNSIPFPISKQLNRNDIPFEKKEFSPFKEEEELPSFKKEEVERKEDFSQFSNELSIEPLNPPFSPPPLTLSKEKTVLEGITDFAFSLNISVFHNLELEGYNIPISCVSGEKAVIMNIIDIPNANWITDQSADILSSDWFSETSYLSMPAFNLQKIAEILKKQEENSEITKVLVLSKGILEDKDIVIEKFKEFDILLAQFDNPKSGLTDLKSILKEIFKKGENL